MPELPIENTDTVRGRITWIEKIPPMRIPMRDGHPARFRQASPYLEPRGNQPLIDAVLLTRQSVAKEFRKRNYILLDAIQKCIQFSLIKKLSDLPSQFGMLPPKRMQLSQR